MSQTDSAQRDALPVGSTVQGYTTEAVLGQGGYGIVYRARRSEYGTRVAIKEYLPTELAIRIAGVVQPRNSASKDPYEDGLRRFSDEAERLREFSDCPNIVSCSDFFWANGTAYMVMEWEDGLPLSRVLSIREEQGSPLDQQELLAVTMPLLQALRRIHSAGVLHRDIKPSNVLLRRKDDQPVLIDFGAAKQAVADRTKSLAPYTEGYAAIEQVGEGELGTWTDIYGIGALMWRIVAGGNPPWNPPNPPRVENRASAVVRGVPDPLLPAVRLGAGRFSKPILQGIDKALALRESDRIQNSDELIACLLEEENSPRGDIQHRRRVVGWSIAACGTVFAALLLFLGPINSSAPAPGTTTARFTVATEPARARVELLDTRDTYRPGIQLPPGLYRVKVSAPGYVSTTIEVKHGDSPSHTRVPLSRRNPPMVKPEIVTAPFTVNPDPVGARVVLLATAKPYRSGMELSLGSYSVEVSAEGYLTRRMSIDHRGSTPYVIRLDRITQPLTVDTEPPTARVELLGESIAYTPGVLLPPGMYRVKVSAPGYESEVALIEHRQSLPHARVALERLREPQRAQPIEQTAALTISTEPTNAKVAILNSERPYVPGMDTAFGFYDLEVSAEGYVTRQVSIHHSGSAPHNVELERRPATFAVNTDPANAQIDIVNSDLSYEAGMRLPAGTYVVQVSATGYETETTEVIHTVRPTNAMVELQPSDFLTLGSHQDDVIRLHGSPSAVSRFGPSGRQDWHYGVSTVTIDTRSKSVVGWNDAGNLKVRRNQDSDSPEPVPTHFEVGADLDEVIRVQGSPAAITRFGNSGREAWHYGPSTVVVDSRSRLVLEIENAGNLKTKP